MSAMSGRAAYQPVSTTGEYNNNGSEVSTKGPKVRTTPFFPKRSKQYDYKPIPLRLPFLVTFILIFAACIACLELLLQHTENTNPVVQSSATPSSHPLTPSLKMKRSGAFYSKPAKREIIDCTDADEIPEQLANNDQINIANCAIFSTSYMPYTRNLSYAQQTGLNSWLADYSSISYASQSLSRTSKLCAGSTPAYEGKMRLGCSTTAFPADASCPPLAKLWITGFALTSKIEKATCTVMPEAALTLTSRSKDSAIDVTSALPTTGTSGVLNLGTPSESPTPTPPSQATTGPSGVLNLGTPTLANPGAAASESPLPTITIPDTINDVAVQATPGNSPTAANSPAVTAEAGANSITVFGILPDPATASQVVTIITDLGGVAATTIVSTIGSGSEARAQTTVQAAVAAAVITYSVTNANGQVQTTGVTQGIIRGTTSLITTTKANGAVETMVAVIGTSVAVTVTYVTTDASGQLHTVVSPVGYASGAGLTTYLSTNSAGIVNTVIAAVTKSEKLYTYVSTNSNGQPVTMVGPTATTSAGYTTITQYTSLVTTTGSDGQPTSFLAVVEQTVVLSSSPTPRTTTATKTSVPQAESSFVIPPSQKIVTGTFNIGKYVAALYVPALVAILIRVLWEIVFAAIKLIEPFERMANTAGLDANYSIFAQYLSNTFTIDSFKSLSHGNLVPLWSATLFLIVHAGPSLAAISMSVGSRDMCSINGVSYRCDPVWLVNVPIIRTLQGILGLGLIVMVLVIWSTQRSPSGILSDPSSLSALAQLLTDSELLDRVQELPPGTDHSHYKMMMSQYYFRLAHHVDGAGKTRYGILGQIPFTKSGNDEGNDSLAYNHNLLRGNKGYQYQAVHDPIAQHSSFNKAAFNTRTHRNRVMDLVGLLFPVAILGLVLAQYLDENLEDVYSKFMNSTTLLPRLLLVVLGSCSSMHLSHLERSVRITEPFRRLAIGSPQSRRAPVPADTTILMSRSGTAYSNVLWCTFLCIRHELHGGRMIFQTLISLTVVLSDIMIIAVSGVPYNLSMTMTSWRLSCYFSIGISSWIILMYLLTIFWWRRNEAVAAVAGRSISKSVGTIGGLMRWLISGGPQVLEMIACMNEDDRYVDSEWRRMRRRGPQVWFAKHEHGDWTLGIDGVRVGAPNMNQGLGNNLPIPVVGVRHHDVDDTSSESLIPTEPEQSQMVSSDRRRWRSDSYYDPPIPVASQYH